MTALTLQELKDLNSALIHDTHGRHGDARSIRLDALHIKITDLIAQEEGK
jgi:hypothetical protein